MVGRALIHAYEHLSFVFHFDSAVVGTRYEQRYNEWDQMTLTQKSELLGKGGKTVDENKYFLFWRKVVFGAIHYRVGNIEYPRRSNRQGTLMTYVHMP